MRIGIILTGDYGWAGGLYYSLNIIKLLHRISLTKRITCVVIINHATPKELLDEIRLQNVEIVNLDDRSFLYKLYCKVMGKITSGNFRFIQDINALNLDVLYPVIRYEDSHKKLNCRVYYWIYDFQHKFLPHLFTDAEIRERDVMFNDVVSKADRIVLSSDDAKKHFYEFYPNSKAQVEVYKFISFLPETIIDNRAKFNIPENYLMVCNQFWPHKNHLVVLKALALLVSQNKVIHVVFTGKFDDNRNRNYVDELKRFISEHGLSSFITLTGFISREDQVGLMKQAKAIIQPSIFEGWSTVIEDAKALNKFLIVSDISINKEQVNDGVLFFDPADSETLSDDMYTVSQQETVVTGLNYSLQIERSGNELATLFKI